MSEKNSCVATSVAAWKYNLHQIVDVGYTCLDIAVR